MDVPVVQRPTYSSFGNPSGNDRTGRVLLNLATNVLNIKQVLTRQEPRRPRSAASVFGMEDPKKVH